MHIIVLPAAGLEATDYRKIKSDSNAPPARCAHTAAVIDDQIYVYGGRNGLKGEVLNEDGVVWVFDTISNRWSKLESSGLPLQPNSRSHHASVATDHPRDAARRTDDGTMPQQPPDPARGDILPEPEAATTYGTLIVYGGLGADGSPLNDLHAFDIASRTWSTLQNPPVTSTPAQSPILAMVAQRLYTYTNGQTFFMDLAKTTFSDKGGDGDLGLSELGPWSPLPGDMSLPKSGPGERTGAAFVPVTTGQGRHYLLLIGGDIPSKSEDVAPSEWRQDIWVHQLKPEGMTAASFKDAARMAFGANTRENHWSEVRYYNPEGVMIQEGQPNRGIGERRGFAVARGTEVDGGSVLVWGGQGDDGKIRGDGLLVTIDI